MAEEVLISIEIEKGDNERQVDALTQKITDLTKATADLKKKNNELVKSGQENSQEYIENTRQIEINKQKIQEASASRKGLIQTIISEDNSIKALNARNAELVRQRNLLSTSTEAGRSKIAEINAEIDKNNKTINENSSALEKQKFNIGNYKSALDGIVPGLGGFISGIEGATKAGLAFIATPIGIILAAIGAALFALTSYFKGSEEGQNNLNKIMAVGSAILEQFMNVAEAAGKVIFEAISNPKQALIDFGNLVKENIINRFEGMLELIPNLGKAVSLLFEGKFAEAGELAFDSVAKVSLGIENATDKIIGFVNETATLIEQGIKNGEAIAKLNAQIDRDERALIVERAKSLVEVGKLREDAITQEGDVRRKTIQEAIALEQALSDKEVGFAKIKLALRQTELKANGDDKEALKAVAQARADVFTAEATAFQNTLKFRKQLAALDEEDAKNKQKEVDEAKKAAKDIEDAEKEQLEFNLQFLETASNERLNKLKERYLNELLSKEEFEAEFSTLELTALETRKAFLVANGEDIAVIESQIIDKKLKNKEREVAAEKKLDDEKKKARLENEKGLKASADAGIAVAKAAFGDTREIAVAESIINTIAGATRAYRDFPFPYSIIVSGLIGVAGALNTLKIAGVKFARGGIAQTGGVLSGPSHANGGIPFAVGGRIGFEAEGGEAIINKKSTQMFRRELSAINQAGGGVSFGRGAVIHQAGSIISGTQTRQAFQQAESRAIVQDVIRAAMSSLPPIVVTVEDINAKQDEVSTTVSRAQVI